MRAAAVTVSVISLIAVVLMIRAAARSGFTVFQGPLVVLELMFLAAVYLIWRALADGDASVTERRPVASQRGGASSHRQPGHRPRSRAVPERASLHPRLSGLADWWFNGLRDPTGADTLPGRLAPERSPGGDSDRADQTGRHGMRGRV